MNLFIDSAKKQNRISSINHGINRRNSYRKCLPPFFLINKDVFVANLCYQGIDIFNSLSLILLTRNKIDHAITCIAHLRTMKAILPRTKQTLKFLLFFKLKMHLGPFAAEFSFGTASVKNEKEKSKITVGLVNVVRVRGGSSRKIGK